MRLFIAIEIPAEIRSTIAAFLEPLRSTVPQAKWVRPENLHVTLKFLGHTAPSQLDSVQNFLSQIHSPQRVTIDFHGLGFFPSERRPRVFWIGMDASPNLQTLAGDLDQAVHKFGFPLENRPFAPHLTLARFDPPGLPPKLAQIVQDNASRSFGSFSAGDFHIIESQLKRSGAEYTTLHSFPFFAEAQR